jgi:streptogrisin B
MRTQLITLVGGLGLTMSTLAGPPPPPDPDPDEPTAAELAEVHEAVEETDVEGVAWYTDEDSGKVVVTTDATVSAGERSEIREAAGEEADALVIKRTDGVFTPMVREAKPKKRAMYPGSAIYGSGVRCSMGFNVRKGNKRYLITAGHCGNQVRTWSARVPKTQRIGPTVGHEYPGSDHALVRYDTKALKRPGGYFGGKAYVGRKVTRIGSTTGQHSGVITGLDVTVRYTGGLMLWNMIQANICAEPGDSGGPLFSGRKAIGITSGGVGACPSRGVTFYEPIQDVLKAYGVRLY